MKYKSNDMKCFTKYPLNLQNVSLLITSIEEKKKKKTRQSVHSNSFDTDTEHILQIDMQKGQHSLRLL